MFVVLEIQVNADKTVGTLVSAYEDRLQAESKYHTVLGAAAISSLPRHSACLVSDEGFVLKSDCYDHPSPEEEENA